MLVVRTFFLAVLTPVGTSSMSMAILSLMSLSFWFPVYIGSSVLLDVVHLCVERVDSYHEELHFGIGWGCICFLLGW